MQAAIRVILVAMLALTLASCGSTKFRKYRGPAVTQVLIDKSERNMWLLHNDEVLKTYDVDLGRSPSGHKQVEGDGKTPEGDYIIDRRNPNSQYHLSIGISYPNEQDVAFAKAQGNEPGGEIFIHGRSRYRGGNYGDWTAGCIAVTDREVETIYAMVRDGTPITIRP